jgi:thioredoxin 1
VISPKGGVIYATRAGELADARGMSESGVYDFFSLAAKGEARKP